MHARVTTYQGNPDDLKQATQILRERVLPGVQEHLRNLIARKTEGS